MRCSAHAAEEMDFNFTKSTERELWIRGQNKYKSLRSF